MRQALLSRRLAASNAAETQRLQAAFTAKLLDLRIELLLSGHSRSSQASCQVGPAYRDRNPAFDGSYSTARPSFEQATVAAPPTEGDLLLDFAILSAVELAAKFKRFHHPGAREC